MQASLVLALLALPLVPRQAGDDLVFDELALRWLQHHEMTPGEAQELGWSGILEQRFPHLSLGLFEVRVPPGALAESGAVKVLSASLGSLLDLQADWMGWLGPGAELLAPVAWRAAIQAQLAEMLGAYTD